MEEDHEAVELGDLLVGVVAGEARQQLLAVRAEERRVARVHPDAQPPLRGGVERHLRAGGAVRRRGPSSRAPAASGAPERSRSPDDFPSEHPL